MHIDGTSFGAITIDGETFGHDVVIRLSGEIVKRRKKLSKKHTGSSHVISEEEARFVFEEGCGTLVLGAGQYGLAGFSPEAGDFLKKHGCQVISEATPQAIKTFNGLKGRKVGLFHVTC